MPWYARSGGPKAPSWKSGSTSSCTPSDAGHAIASDAPSGSTGRSTRVPARSTSPTREWGFRSASPASGCARCAVRTFLSVRTAGAAATGSAEGRTDRQRVPCAYKEACRHSRNRLYRVSVVSMVTAIKGREVSVVAQSANPEARFVSIPVSTDRLVHAFGPGFKAGRRVSCDKCLGACWGFDELSERAEPGGRAGTVIGAAMTDHGELDSRLAARSGNGSGRSPASKALLGKRPSGPQHQAKPAASLVVEEEPSPAVQGEGHGRGEDPGSAAPKNLPAYGAWNVWKVTTGTGEALPGPVTLRRLPELPVL